MKAFRLLGIDIHINASWILVFLLIFWSFAAGFFPAQYPELPRAWHVAAGLASTILFFVSVLLHELSHSIVARRHGVIVRRITLFIFGGVSHLEGESPDPAVEVRIAAAGPLLSFLLGAIFLVASWIGPDPRESIWSGTAGHLGVLNIALGVFNMLPGFPLDGGRVLRAWYWGRSGDRVGATRSAATWGRVLGWTLIAAGGLAAVRGHLLQGLWMVFIGMFLKEAATAEERQAMMGGALSGVRVGSVMTPEPVTIPFHASVHEALHDYFLRHGHGGYPVTRDGNVVGVVSLSHLSRPSTDDRESTTVGSIMTPLAPDQMSWPDEEVLSAMSKMADAGVSRLPVLETARGGRLVGLVTLQAITRRMQIAQLTAGEDRRSLG